MSDYPNYPIKHHLAELGAASTDVSTLLPAGALVVGFSDSGAQPASLWYSGPGAEVCVLCAVHFATTGGNVTDGHYHFPRPMPLKSEDSGGTTRTMFMTTALGSVATIFYIELKD